MEPGPLGDRAALTHLTDEAAALRFAAAVRQAQPAWLVDVVQAYASVAVFFDPDQVRLGNPGSNVRQHHRQRPSLVNVAQDRR
jgi:allophanate hydrolase subunit 1